MLTKKFAKYIQSLNHKKFRDHENAFIAEGPKVVSEYLEAKKFKCKYLCAQKEWIPKNAHLLNSLPLGSIIEVKEDDLKRLSFLKTPHLVLAVFEKPAETVLPKIDHSLTIMLDDLQDPGNMGTIIRIADWFGIENIIASENSVDCYNPKVVQAAMGSLLRVNVNYTPLIPFLKKADGVPVYAATLQGKSVYDLEAVKEGILIIGNESKGISYDIQQHCDTLVSIPSFGGAESLNAAVATGIIVALFRR